MLFKITVSIFNVHVLKRIAQQISSGVKGGVKTQVPNVSMVCFKEQLNSS